jgi:hypothetical protein
MSLFASGALFSVPCTLHGNGPKLWWGRARLYPDAVVLSGWTPRGRYHRRLPLDGIRHAKWWGGGSRGDMNYVLRLTTGEVLALELRRSSGRWHMKLQRLLGRHDLHPPSRLPETKSDYPSEPPLPPHTGPAHEGDGAQPESDGARGVPADAAEDDAASRA